MDDFVTWEDIAKYMYEGGLKSACVPTYTPKILVVVDIQAGIDQSAGHVSERRPIPKSERIRAHSYYFHVIIFINVQKIINNDTTCNLGAETCCTFQHSTYFCQ